MMHYACCKKWIEFYQTKIRELEQECALFHKHNQRGTTSLPKNLREENWPQECSRSWMKNELEKKTTRYRRNSR